jgi:hypothetical protein
MQITMLKHGDGYYHCTQYMGKKKRMPYPRRNTACLQTEIDIFDIMERRENLTRD